MLSTALQTDGRWHFALTATFTESFMSAEVVAAAYGPAGYYADDLCEYITGNMNFLTEYLLREIPGVRAAKPDATYLLWADFSHCGVAAEDVMRVMCGKARVAPDPGEWFGEGYKGYLRINVAMPRHMIEEAARRMAEAMRG